MRILWNYLKPQRYLILISLILATIGQLLTLIDPVIFGKIIDDYAMAPASRPQKELINGVLFWLAIAIAVAMAARIAKAFQDYFSKMAVAAFGMHIFNEGLKQTLRLNFQEFEESRSGETLSVLQKVKTDTERFITSFINILFSSVIGIGFLIWYSITKNWMLIPVFVIGILVLGSLTGLLSKK
jgi:ATP-binding cassette subfamily B protein